MPAAFAHAISLLLPLCDLLKEETEAFSSHPELPEDTLPAPSTIDGPASEKFP